MQKDFILPDIGEGIVECELVEWLVAAGEQIEEDQPVAEVMTDKAVVQIPAMYSGTVTELYYQKGDIAKVHQPLFAMQVGEPSAGQEPSAKIEPSADQDQSADQNQSADQHAVTTEHSTAAQTEDFILPDIGEGIVECELVKWLIAEGDTIAEDQPVAEVMTDKAVVEIPAKYSGKVTRLYYQQGDIAKVHQPLYCMEIAGSTVESSVGSTASQSAPASANSSQQSTKQASQTASVTQASGDTPPVRQGKAIASPAVRRRAREMGIDISRVVGTGKKGRVMKDDLHAHVNASSSAKQQAVSANTPAAQVNSAAPANVQGGKRTEPIRGIKAAMAKQMSDSVYTIPHFTVSDEIVMDNLIATRAQLKPEFEKNGVKLSFMPFIIKAMSLALKQFPIINSQVNSDCTELTYFDDHNIGMAVDSKIGLLVPNIKQVQNLSLFEVAQEASRLIEAGREGRLNQADLKGGTISISNVGVIGGTVAVPVINKPEAAIVALGKMQKLPRFDENDQVKAVNIMHISWSGDHRIIDGATMVRFSNAWKSYLENPLTMLGELR